MGYENVQYRIHVYFFYHASSNIVGNFVYKIWYELQYISSSYQSEIHIYFWANGYMVCSFLIQLFCLCRFVCVLLNLFARPVGSPCFSSVSSSQWDLQHHTCFLSCRLHPPFPCCSVLCCWACPRPTNLMVLAPAARKFDLCISWWEGALLYYLRNEHFSV